MAWIEVTADIVEAAAESCQEVLEGLGALAVTFQETDSAPVLEPAPGTTPLWDKLKIVGLFDHHAPKQVILAALQAQCPEIPFTLSILPDQDWTRAWLEHFHPQRFGENFWIMPSDYPNPPDLGPNPVVLHLDPGLAFGTGTHPTTALCLSWLANNEIAQKTVIDFGCGSGILGIGACLLGAQQVWAIDHDPQAIIATQSNAAQNKIPENQICVMISEDNIKLPKVDVVLANILAEPLIRLAPMLQAHCLPNGHIVLSGILKEQAQNVLAAYQPWFEFAPIQEQDNWVCLVGTKKPVGDGSHPTV